ncbi:unnamed protein product [Boreogadus saida]
MDEEREDGGPTSKTTLSGEHGRRSKAKRTQERADSPGPSCVSMKSDLSMERPPDLKDGRSSREERHQERSMVTSAQSVQHQTEQEELANTLWVEELRRIRSEFVEGVSDPVIKGLLDDLYHHKVFKCSEEKDHVMAGSTKADQARCMIDMVIGKGERASQAMIDSMKKRDQHLCSTLGLMSSLPGVARDRAAARPRTGVFSPIDGRAAEPVIGLQPGREPGSGGPRKSAADFRDLPRKSAADFRDLPRVRGRASEYN